MGDENVKNFRESRTLSDIMEAYGEQRDEWVTYLSRDNGFVRQFRHSNGKTFFCEQIEDYIVDEKIVETLKGKTIEQQMSFYYVTASRNLSETAYGDITKERLSEKAVKLAEYKELVQLLLKGDILVGAIIKGQYRDCNLLIGKPVCTYFASDNEGSGTKERVDYAYLVFSDK